MLSQSCEQTVPLFRSASDMMRLVTCDFTSSLMDLTMSKGELQKSMLCSEDFIRGV